MPGLEDLYREIILDHYRSPRERGELPTPPATMTEGFNPLCGDEIKLYVIIDNGIVTDIKFAGQGCSISQSSASMMTAALKGKSLADARALLHRFKSMMNGEEHDSTNAEAGKVRLGDLEALKGVVKFPVRIKCATLAWNTFAQALDEAT